MDLRIVYVLAEPPPGWTGGVGNVTPEMVETALDDIPQRRALRII